MGSAVALKASGDSRTSIRARKVDVDGAEKFRWLRADGTPVEFRGMEHFNMNQMITLLEQLAVVVDDPVFTKPLNAMGVDMMQAARAFGKKAHHRAKQLEASSSNATTRGELASALSSFTSHLKDDLNAWDADVVKARRELLEIIPSNLNRSAAPIIKRLTEPPEYNVTNLVELDPVYLCRDMQNTSMFLKSMASAFSEDFKDAEGFAAIAPDITSLVPDLGEKALPLIKNLSQSGVYSTKALVSASDSVVSLWRQIEEAKINCTREIGSTRLFRRNDSLTGPGIPDSRSGAVGFRSHLAGLAVLVVGAAAAILA